MAAGVVDEEKGHAGFRRSSDIERPPSRTSESSAHSGQDDDYHHHHHHRRGEKEARENDTDEEDEDHRNDLVPAATMGEPSGEGIYACEPTCSPCRTRSRTSSIRSRPLAVVPRGKRRGLFAGLTVLPEVERPYDYKNSTKWAITATVSFAAAAAPMGSSIFYPALPALIVELGSTKTIANLSIALYMLSMAIFPLWWSSFSEQLGRRTIYLVSYAMFVAFSVLSAVSTNMPMLIVFRACSGGASASVQAVGAGTIADIWESFERGRAMSFFYLGPLLGPLFAPIIGGVLAQELGWQATMWFLAIYGLLCFLIILLLLPETISRKRSTAESAQQQQQQQQDGGNQSLSRVSTRASAKMRTKSIGRVLKRSLVDPLSVLLFLRFPAVAITVLIGAIAFSSLYVSSIAIQQVYSQEPYNFGQLIVGLLYAPPGLGYITASLFGGKWIDKIMAREARKANRYDENGKLVLLPEDRMRENLWAANAIYPLSLLAFGWTLRYGVHWAAPSVALYFFGVSSMLVFASVTTMLTEFVRKKSSAGVAVNNFVRNLLSAVGVVVASSWIDAVGTGWVFTTLCIFCIVAGFAGVLGLKRNAQRWRKGMDAVL